MTSEKKIRLLILTDSQLHLAGGSETHIRNLVRRLDSERYQVSIIQLGRDRPPPERELELGPAVTYVGAIPIGRLYSPAGLRSMLGVWRIVREQNAGILQTYHEKSDLIASLMPERQAQNLVRISSRRDMGFKRSLAVRIAARFLDQRFDAFVAPAKAILNQLSADPTLDDIPQVHIPNGVDVEAFGTSWEVGRSVIDRLNLPSHTVKVACVANFNPVKGHDVLFDALKRLGPESPVHLLLAGGGQLEDKLRQRVEAEGLNERVSFVGVLRDVRELLSRVDVMVLSSYSEGMSNALLEGLASGLPLVATAVGGNREVIEDGVNGYLVPPGDPQALASALSRLAQDSELRRRLGVASRELAVASYSTRVMVDRFEALYARLLSPKGLAA